MSTLKPSEQVAKARPTESSGWRPPGDHSQLTRADVMTAVDVAELLTIPKSTVEDWARRKVIPSRKRGKRRLFLRWEIEEWLTREDP
jgi:excisionase family DNA binding protein